MNATIAVTGSTGAVGGMVARQLSGRGIAQRLLVRDAARAPRLPGAEVHAAGYAEGDAVREALDGVEVVFMVSASESESRLDEHRTFVDAAARAGVRHIVYTSFAAAAPDATFTLARDHHATEEHIKASGMRWTFLRDCFYIDFMEELVGPDGVIRGPAGDGAVAVVARADVSRSATAILADPDAHVGRTYLLTGPEALTLAEVAAVISGVRGAEVTFHDETVAEAYASRRDFGAPAWQVDAWVSTYTAIKGGALATVSGDVAAITGAGPMSLGDFLRAHPR